MKLPTIGANKDGAIFLVTVAVLAVGLVYFLRKQIADAADLAGGLVSGDNAITRGTVYQGTGVAGTLGAAANSASGGALESVGDWIGGKIFDWTHDEYDPNAPVVLQTRKQAVTGEFYNQGVLTQ
jgi:hypothetical protein